MEASEVTIGGVRIRNPATLLLFAAMLASAVVLVVLGSRLTFLLDDWTYIVGRRDFDLDAFMQPANEHFVAGPVVIWKSLLALFGIGSTVPYRIVSTAVFLLGVWFMFVWMRRRIGDWAALIAAIPVLFLGAAFDDFLWFASLTFLGSLTCGLGMLLALDRRDAGGDLRACLWLIGSLLFSGLWLPFAAGAAIDIVLRRGERDWRSRIYVVAIPVVLFVIWWLGWGHDAEGSFAIENIGTMPLFVLDSIAAGVAALFGLATPAPGVAAPSGLDWGRPLVVLLGALALWRAYTLQRIPRSLWVVLAIGLAFWVLGGLLVKDGRVPWASRYQLPSVTFLLLVAAELLRGVKLDRRLLAPAMVVVVAAVASSLVFLHSSYQSYRVTSIIERGALAGLEVARDDVDPSLVLSEDIADTGYVAIEAGAYLSARDAFGSPAYSETEIVDAPEVARVPADKVAARALGASLLPTPAPSRIGCEALTIQPREPIVVELPGGGMTMRAVGGKPIAVSLGRFAETYPVDLGTLWGAWRTLLIPPDRSSLSWRIALTGPGRVEICS